MVEGTGVIDKKTADTLCAEWITWFPTTRLVFLTPSLWHFSDDTDLKRSIQPSWSDSSWTSGQCFHQTRMCSETGTFAYNENKELRGSTFSQMPPSPNGRNRFVISQKLDGTAALVCSGLADLALASMWASRSGFVVCDFLDSHPRPVPLKDRGGADGEYQWHCTPHCERLCVLGGDPSLAGCIVSWVCVCVGRGSYWNSLKSP